MIRYPAAAHAILKYGTQCSCQIGSLRAAYLSSYARIFVAAQTRNVRSCREECTTNPADDRGPVVFDLARYGQRQSRMSVPGCDSMTHGNGLSLALFSWGAAFDLKRRPATPPSRVTASARRHAGCARTRRPVWRLRRQRGWACSRLLTIRASVRAILVSELRTVPLPQLRTHSPDGAVDRG